MRRRRRIADAMAVAAVVVAAASCGGDGGSDGSDGAAGAAATTGTIAVAPLPPVRPTTTVAADAVGSDAVGSDAVGSSTSDADPDVTTTDSSATTATTTAPTTSTTAPSTPPTTVRPTSTTLSATASAGPCDLTRIVTETGAVYDGITPDDLRCAGAWATWIGRPDDQFADGFFAVASWTGQAWVLANLGTAGVCEDAGVPSSLWGRLGCTD